MMWITGMLTLLLPILSPFVSNTDAIALVLPLSLKVLGIASNEDISIFDSKAAPHSGATGIVQLRPPAP